MDMEEQVERKLAAAEQRRNEMWSTLRTRLQAMQDRGLEMSFDALIAAVEKTEKRGWAMSGPADDFDYLVEKLEDEARRRMAEFLGR